MARNKTESVVRNEGQRRLLEIKATESEIALACGVRSCSAVGWWRGGTKIPKPATQARLASAYGIPVRAWSLAPGGTPDPLPPLPDGGGNGHIPSTLEDCLALAAVIRQERNVGTLIPSERVKLATAESRILALRANLEQAQQYSEARYVTAHPSWRKLRDSIVAALEPYPLALQAVIEAIERMDKQ